METPIHSKSERHPCSVDTRKKIVDLTFFQEVLHLCHTSTNHEHYWKLRETAISDAGPLGSEIVYCVMSHRPPPGSSMSGWRMASNSKIDGFIIHNARMFPDLTLARPRLKPQRLRLSLCPGHRLPLSVHSSIQICRDSFFFHLNSARQVALGL